MLYTGAVSSLPSRFQLFAATAVLLLLTIARSAAGQDNGAPEAPVIIEPYTAGQEVNPADVHMETAPFDDPDAGDTHLCSDFAIWSVAPERLAWEANCVQGISRRHIHLGDGAFVNAHAGQRELFFETDYELRVRYRDGSRDDATAWSAWSRRRFRTAAPAVPFPLAIGRIEPSPAPVWLTAANAPLDTSLGELTLTVQSRSGSTLLTMRPGEAGTPGGDDPAHEAIRVAVASGETAVTLPPTTLFFTDEAGVQQAIYLPPLTLAPENRRSFWVAANGSTYQAGPDEEEPTFNTIAQTAAIPWRVAQPGYQVDIVATGFQLPVNIAFAPEPPSTPDAPAFYVTELYGSVKVVTGAGEVHDFATGLLNFDPTGNFPGSGELGLTGLAVEPVTGDLYVGLLYAADPAARPPVFHPRILRLRPDATGLAATAVETVLDMAPAVQGESHQIGALSFGPDGYLYAQMGDGHDPEAAADHHNFVGKILRLETTGAPAADNPFYDPADGIDAADYLYATGFRNPFGGAWRATDSTLYTVENGPKLDRLAPVRPGADYGWDGSDSSMYHQAIFNWFPSVAPVNIAFIQPETYDGSGFPAAKMGHAFVTESGATWASGPQERGKRISEFILSRSGELLLGPVPFVVYDGAGKASVAALAAGPDGLYFSDLYKDFDYETPIDRGANILRVSFTGAVDFEAEPVAGPAPLAVRFTNLSTRNDIESQMWEFGDGMTSREANPTHRYERSGSYDVRLTVETAAGRLFTQQSNLVAVDIGAGLHGEYFFDRELRDLRLTRIDPTVDFEWRFQSPAPLALLADGFSVRWLGQIAPEIDGLYTFYSTSDDGARLWVDGRLLVDDWNNHPETENSGRIRLEGGRRYDIVYTTYDDAGLALSRLEWSADGVPRQVVPTAHLYPYPLPDPAGLEQPSARSAAVTAAATAVSSLTPFQMVLIAGGVLWLIAVFVFVRRIRRS